MKKLFFSFVLALSSVACTTTNMQENERQQAFEKVEEVLTTPNDAETNTSSKTKYEDLNETQQGGIVNVQINHQDFAEKDYIFETLRSENVISYDADAKMLTIMAENYQNSNTNISIVTVGGKEGSFPIKSSSERSATVTFYYNNGLANIGGNVEEGTLTIDSFDENRGYVKGRIVGKAKGVDIQADIEIFATPKQDN